MASSENGAAVPSALVAVGEASAVLSFNSIPQTLATQTHAIGVIAPPPDIRAIADKTAQFVARNGVEFEKRILANEANNAKFNFLRPGDPYNAYYQSKVAEFKGGQPPTEAGASEGEKPSSLPAAPPPLATPPTEAKPVLPPAKPLEPPEAEHYTAHVPEGLSLLDVDVMKLTAQFVARNGKSFLTGLASREHANPQFNFLKPTHSLFAFFTRLCDAYSRCLMPPKGLISGLRQDVEDRSAVLQRAVNRLEFNRVKSREDQDAAAVQEAERLAMQSIDWHDFVVVETIDLDDAEDAGLPQPLTLKDVMQMARGMQYRQAVEASEEKEDALGAEGRTERSGNGMDAEERELVAQAQLPVQVSVPTVTAAPAISDEDMDMEVSDDEAATPVKILKNYRRPQSSVSAPVGTAGAYDPTKFVVSPFTGELVPIGDMGEHMRISLIDPRWKSQRDAMLAKIKETTKATDEEISRNLGSLAKTRPDVFGGGQEALSSAVGEQIERDRASGLQEQVAKRPRI